MIEDYSWGACPVIEEEDLNKALLYLPTREQVNKETNSDTFIAILDEATENHVIFDWDETGEGWRLRSKVIFTPNEGIITCFCRLCSDRATIVPSGHVLTYKETEHIVNKALTKKKCKTCNTVSDI